VPSSSPANDFFETLVLVVIGDGMRSLFWSDRWINGASVKTLTPNLLAAVPTRIRNKRTVAEAIMQRKWVKDIRLALTVKVLAGFGTLSVTAGF
jgi:hypothetical protein